MTRTLRFDLPQHRYPRAPSGGLLPFDYHVPLLLEQIVQAGYGAVAVSLTRTTDIGRMGPTAEPVRVGLWWELSG